MEYRNQDAYETRGIDSAAFPGSMPSQTVPGTAGGEDVRESLYLREDGEVSQSLLGNSPGMGWGGPSHAGSGVMPQQML